MHRVGSKTAGKYNPRPIMAKFTYFQQKEGLWKYVRNLKGTKLAISDDFEREIDHIRKTLYPVMKNAKRNNQKAFFSVDRLLINGQVYGGPEILDLPFYGSILNQ